MANSPAPPPPERRRQRPPPASVPLGRDPALRSGRSSLAAPAATPSSLASPAFPAAARALNRVAAKPAARAPGGRSGSPPASSSRREEWEVFISHRALRSQGSSFYHSLPDFLKAELRDVGLCHYMAVLRKKSPPGRAGSHGAGRQEGGDAGEIQDLIQFDFGPRGFDITFHSSRRGSFPFPSPSASAARSDRTSELALASLGSRFAAPDGSRPRRRQGVPDKEASTCPLSFAGSCSPLEMFEGLRRPNGEVRQEKLHALPASSELVGVAVMSLDEIQAFNRTHNCEYVLNRNDCRHYVDALVQHMTGVDKACARFTRSKVQQRLRQRPLQLADPLIQLAQLALEKESADPLARIWETIFASVTEKRAPAPDSPLPAVAFAIMNGEEGYRGAPAGMERQAGLALLAHSCNTGMREYAGHSSPAGAAAFSSSMAPHGYGGSPAAPSSRRANKTSASVLVRSGGQASATAMAALAGSVLSRGLSQWQHKQQLARALHMQKQLWTAGAHQGAAASPLSQGSSLRTAKALRSHRLWASLPSARSSLRTAQRLPGPSTVQRAFSVRGAFSAPQGNLQRCCASGAAGGSAHVGIRTGWNRHGGAALKRLAAAGMAACRGAAHPVQSFACAVQCHSQACVQGVRLGLTLLGDPLSIQGSKFSY